MNRATKGGGDEYESHEEAEGEGGERSRGGEALGGTVGEDVRRRGWRDGG